jgi:hypothetical protein
VYRNRCFLTLIVHTQVADPYNAGRSAFKVYMGQSTSTLGVCVYDFCQFIPGLRNNVSQHVSINLRHTAPPGGRRRLAEVLLPPPPPPPPPACVPPDCAPPTPTPPPPPPGERQQQRRAGIQLCFGSV